jgi:hypothetical protein
MVAIDYLVPSRARRDLLRAVRASGGTLRQLSKRARVPYSSAHRELMAMQRAGLVRARRAGRAVTVSWNAASPGARAVALLLESGPPDEARVIGSLVHWGAPLLRAGSSGRPLSLEETLALALLTARRRPEVARVWPVVLARNRGSVDLALLDRLARRAGEKRTLGFFLALTRRLLADPTLAPWERRLRDGRVRRDQPFFLLPRGRRARRLAEERTPSVARSWRFRMNMSFDAFETTFRKFVAPR